MSPFTIFIVNQQVQGPMEGPNVSKWISWVPKIYLSTLHCLKAALPPPNDQHYHPWKNSHSASCLLIPCHKELKVAGWQSQVKLNSGLVWELGPLSLQNPGLCNRKHKPLLGRWPE